MAIQHYLIRNANASDMGDILKIANKAFSENRFYMDFDQSEIRYHLEFHPSLCQVAIDTRGELVAFGLAKSFHPVIPDHGQLSWFASAYGAGGSGLQLTRQIRDVVKSEFKKERVILDVDVKNKIVLNRVMKTPGAELIATYQMISVPSFW